MVDMITSQLSSKVLDKAVSDSAKTANIQPAGGDSTFKNMMNEMDSGADFAKSLGMGGEQVTMNPVNQPGSISADNISFDPNSMTVGIEQPNGAEKVVDMLSEVNKGQLQMDSMVNEILYSGKKFGNQELLAIQAHIFHFAQMTEMTVKVAEHGIGSVRTILQTQMGS